MFVHVSLQSFFSILLCSEQPSKNCEIKPRLVAVILGHGYIRRLGERYNQGMLPHRGPKELELHFIGVGGGRVCAQNPENDLFMKIPEVRSYHPDVIFIQAGENDVPYVSSRRVVDELLALAEALAHECHPHTIITGQLVHFPAQDPLGPISKAVHDSLTAYHSSSSNTMAGSTRLQYWRHRIGFYGNSSDYFADDVNLNELGILKFYKSIMATVGKRAREVLLDRQRSPS